MSTSDSPAANNVNPEVDAWFKKLDHPLLDAMLLVRQYILEADERISEAIKWSAPTFNFEGNIASFQPRAKRFVSLMFHRGSEIPGDHATLLGDAALVRTMRFKDLADVEAQREALQAIVRAWCDYAVPRRVNTVENFQIGASRTCKELSYLIDEFIKDLECPDFRRTPVFNPLDIIK